MFEQFATFHSDSDSDGGDGADEPGSTGVACSVGMCDGGSQSLGSQSMVGSGASMSNAHAACCMSSMEMDELHEMDGSGMDGSERADGGLDTDGGRHARRNARSNRLRRKRRRTENTWTDEMALTYGI